MDETLTVPHRPPLRPAASSTARSYADVRATQERIRRDHRAAQARRLAWLRARRRCEDLAEFLGQMALLPRDPDQAADLLRRSLVAARDIEGLVTGTRGAARQRHWRRQRREIARETLNRLEDIVELLDDAIRDGPLVDEDGDPDARRLAAELATTLAVGVEALAAPGLRR